MSYHALKYKNKIIISSISTDVVGLQKKADVNNAIVSCKKYTVVEIFITEK